MHLRADMVEILERMRQLVRAVRKSKIVMKAHGTGSVGTDWRRWEMVHDSWA